jgi:hypothetical protein
MLAWTPQYTAHILSHLLPSNDWEMFLAMDRLKGLGKSEIAFDFNSSQILYYRNDVEQFAQGLLPTGLTLKEVAERIDAFEEAEAASEWEPEEEDGRGSVLYEYDLRLDEDECDTLLEALESIEKKQGQAQGANLALSYALSLIADRSAGQHADELSRLALLAKALAGDACLSHLDIRTIYRFLEERSAMRAVLGTAPSKPA